MPALRGSLHKKDGQVLAEVQGSYEVDARAGRLESWSGSLNPDRGLTTFGEYLLRFEDGRWGNIIVDRVSVGPDDAPLIQFVGCGPIHDSGQTE